jgi:aarF domain-containing kinase
VAVAVVAVQIFDAGFVHCDPHPANLFIRPHALDPSRPQLVLLDHGL